MRDIKQREKEIKFFCTLKFVKEKKYGFRGNKK